MDFKSKQYYTQKRGAGSLQQPHELKRKYFIFPWKSLNSQSAVIKNYRAAKDLQDHQSMPYFGELETEAQRGK